MKKPNKSEPLKSVLFEITDIDIENGKSDICPIEFSMARALKPGLFIAVGANAVLIKEKTGDRRVCERFLTRYAREFVRNFDTDKDDVAPMKFKLRLPLWVRREAQ